mmetsp:Transcript_619/g.1681  ORF Transcript_619/g.1681 Transcript_619/m.1681 type:complete len:122 (+) Transcript_619:1744-2109(+)
MSLRALAVLALALGASAKRATGRKHAPPSDGSVGALTSASLDAVLASSEPAFLILWPTGPCPTCDPLREFWRLLALHHRGTAWQASCAREPIVCAGAGIPLETVRAPGVWRDCGSRTWGLA